MKRQREAVLRKTGKEAQELILASRHSTELVQSLADEDFYLMVQEIGPEDALPIISMASTRQWQYLLDLEIWHRDRITEEKAIYWLSLLFSSNLRRCLDWLRSEEPDWFIFLLLKGVRVIIKEKDQDPSELPDDLFTMDGVFYVQFLNTESESFLRKTLESMAQNDYEQYQKTLLELSSYQIAELEEEAYRTRNIRLGEKGFLPFEEAVGIYQYLRPDSLAKPSNKRVDQLPETEDLWTSPYSYSVVALEERNVFSLALQHIQRNVRERILVELAGLTNHVIVADLLLVTDREVLRKAMRKVCGYVSIGLQRLGGKDSSVASYLIEKYSLLTLFRFGYSGALEVKWDVQKWIRKSWFSEQRIPLSFLDSPWEEQLSGLLRKRPLFYAGPAGYEGEYREFEDISEIEDCRTALNRIMALEKALKALFEYEALSRFVEYVEKWYNKNLNHTVTYKNVLLTAFARHFLHKDELLAPLSLGKFREFFRMLWLNGSAYREVRPHIKEVFLEWLTKNLKVPDIETAHRLQEITNQIFADLRNELMYVSPEDLDPRYIRLFILKAEE
nr:hypothetical protein [Desulfobacterales bacterium]